MNLRSLALIAWLFYAQSRASVFYYGHSGLPEKGLIIDLSCEPYEAGLNVIYGETARLILAALFFLRYPNEPPFSDYFFEDDADLVKRALLAAQAILEHRGPGMPMRCINLKFCQQGRQRRALAQVGDWNGKDEYDTINLCPKILVGVQNYDPCEPYGFQNGFQVRAPMTLLHEIIQGRQLLGTGHSIAKDYVYGAIECKILRRDALTVPREELPAQPRDNVDSYAQYAKAALIAVWKNDKNVQKFCMHKGLLAVARIPPEGLVGVLNSALNLNQNKEKEGEEEGEVDDLGDNNYQRNGVPRRLSPPNKYYGLSEFHSHKWIFQSLVEETEDLPEGVKEAGENP